MRSPFSAHSNLPISHSGGWHVPFCSSHRPAVAHSVWSDQSVCEPLQIWSWAPSQWYVLGAQHASVQSLAAALHSAEVAQVFSMSQPLWSALHFCSSAPLHSYSLGVQGAVLHFLLVALQ